MAFSSRFYKDDRSWGTCISILVFAALNDLYEAIFTSESVYCWGYPIDSDASTVVGSDMAFFVLPIQEKYFIKLFY
jgi:hypothetical protein